VLERAEVISGGVVEAVDRHGTQYRRVDPGEPQRRFQRRVGSVSKEVG
jgi:hypothetical protein